MGYEKEKAYRILKKYWGYEDFRPLQEEIIAAVVHQKDTLALMPTGGGKSLCFQIPALYMDGICLVITPLISLMKDQVAHLKKRNIPALAIHSGMNFREVRQAFENALYGPYKFLYLSPERLQTDLFLDYLKDLPINLITVDEAHCISQWGYDFRPTYLQIGTIREELPRVPVLAITATATLEVRADIQKHLLFKEENVLVKSFFRENLSYSVFEAANKFQKLEDILRKVAGSSIVFCRSRKRTEEISNRLQKLGINADYYHAGLTTALRNEKQNHWIKDELRVMVCTNAFGMGIDKPDVRTVVHFDVPESPEAYYQEAGRAGRDGKKSYAVLLFNEQELMRLEESVAWKFPAFKQIKACYKGIVNYLQLPAETGGGQYFDFDLKDFCKKFNQPIRLVTSALRILEQEEYLFTTENIFLSAKASFLLSKDRLGEFEQSFPKLTPLIHCLLRTYQGIFKNKTAVFERQIARLLKYPYKQVVTEMKQLHQLGVIDYEPKKESPQIYFIDHRVAVDRLKINQKMMAARKKAYLKRINAMVDYARQKKQCRSQTLLKYFNEPHSPKCGICDICLRIKREKKPINWENKIMTMILEKPQTGKELIRQFSSVNQDFVFLALRNLLDEEYLKIDQDNKLHWIKKKKF